MSHSVGIDIIEVERVRQALREDGFRDRVFTAAEIEYCEARSVPERHYAARFAAKEAVAKALGLEWPRFLEIEVAREESGKPVVILHGSLGELASERGQAVTVSISHLAETAAAAAVAFPL